MAKKVKRILFGTNYYESGVAKYEKGKHYAVTEETRTRVLAGDAAEIDVEMEPAAAAEDEAQAKARREAELAQTLAAESGAQDRPAA